MYLQYSSDDKRLTPKQQASSQITSCCLLTDDEIEQFVNDQYLSLLMPFNIIFSKSLPLKLFTLLILGGLITLL